MFENGTPIKWHGTSGQSGLGTYVEPYAARGAFPDEHVIRDEEGHLVVFFGKDIEKA